MSNCRQTKDVGIAERLRLVLLDYGLSSEQADVLSQNGFTSPMAFVLLEQQPHRASDNSNYATFTDDTTAMHEERGTPNEVDEIMSLCIGESPLFKPGDKRTLRVFIHDLNQQYGALSANLGMLRQQQQLGAMLQDYWHPSEEESRHGGTQQQHGDMMAQDALATEQGYYTDFDQGPVPEAGYAPSSYMPTDQNRSGTAPAQMNQYRPTFGQTSSGSGAALKRATSWDSSAYSNNNAQYLMPQPSSNGYYMVDYTSAPAAPKPTHDSSKALSRLYPDPSSVIRPGKTNENPLSVLSIWLQKNGVNPNQVQSMIEWEIESTQSPADVSAHLPSPGNGSYGGAKPQVFFRNTMHVTIPRAIQAYYPYPKVSCRSEWAVSKQDAKRGAAEAMVHLLQSQRLAMTEAGSY
ncbi:hypothetical protein RI367_002281 [Sorochytrium milnesiophthora]